MLVSELLADSLGAEPTDRNIWLATRRDRSGMTLALDMIERYRSSDTLEPVPSKTPSTFRPAFLLDYYGESDTPYDREFAFVARSLSYADQVAVVDEIAGWAAQPDPEAYLAEMYFGGFPECGHLPWALRRIGRYAELERAQLLYYVEPPTFRDENAIREGVATDAAPDLSFLVEERRGWIPTVKDTPRGRGMVVDELAFWFQQLHAVLDHSDHYHQSIDLYLPDWFAGPQLLEWLYRSSTPPEWVTAQGLKDQQAVSQLLDLPAPSAEIVQQLSVAEILAVRDADHMSQWRNHFRTEIGHLAASSDLATRMEVQANIADHVQQLQKTERLTSALRGGLRDSIQAGIAVAPVAAFTHQNLLATTLEAASPAVVGVASSMLRWLMGRSPEDGNGEVRNRVAETVALRTYLNEPLPPGGRRRTPNSSMRTMDGRAVAFDPFGGRW
ncbi:hypothetical protein [Microbacterium sp. MYb62]|uniref:hypothetical protein n=1 Tax=Microbacterium sp. MYb62 TaxID=1848690 RepID=UPI000CFD9741|nr:hypothetical protein [Microbacterium sp. MYb62]PRB10858.1 hypothetical protein CQ042_17510 [Microbacterium sp. MYb62]